MKCERCGRERGYQVKGIGFVSLILLRPNGQNLCSDCECDRIREMSPTGFFRRLRHGYYGGGT